MQERWKNGAKTVQERCKNGARTVQEKSDELSLPLLFPRSSDGWYTEWHAQTARILHTQSPGTWLHRFAVSNRTRDDGVQNRNITLRDQAPSERVHSSRSSSAPSTPIFTLKTEKHSHCVGLSSYPKEGVCRCDGRGDTEREDRTHPQSCGACHRPNGVSPLQMSMQTHPLSKKPPSDPNSFFSTRKIV